jgi:transposase
MDFHLDKLLNLPHVTVDSCLHEEGFVCLKLRFLTEAGLCPHCQQFSQELHQTRPMLVRDLSISGQVVQLEIPRRQFYCSRCQHYFTEGLSFVDWEQRYTQRYEDYIYQRVQVSSVEQVSREEGLSWDQVQGIFDHQFHRAKKSIGAVQNG